MGTLQAVALMAATLTVGLVAGLFFAFACAVMPGLRRSDDRAFVEVMQRINVAILNGWFLFCFLGAPVFTGLATALHLRADGRAALPWTIAGLVLYAVVLIVTAAVNVPLNNRLEAAGPPGGGAGAAAVRERFEATWVRWNLVRAVASTAAFGALAWALVLHGRAA
ncbi:anthrone oxygenase family protein [Streptomyces syringium]|uniref:anthrone oxygenase family protein n=1 Tax=Streptomyces syringium TaxID=76729 RepID=UPI0033A21C22